MTTNGIDPNQMTGWNVQSSAPSPYSQPGITAATAALTKAGNGAPGAPDPVPGNVADILANPGYGDVSPSIMTPGNVLPSALVPVPATGAAFTNPVGVPCAVDIAGGALTSVKVGGVQVGTSDGTYTVPGGAQVTLSYTAAPTWTWTTA